MSYGRWGPWYSRLGLPGRPLHQPVCKLHVVAARSAALVSDEKRIRGVYTRRCAIQITTFTFLSCLRKDWPVGSKYCWCTVVQRLAFPASCSSLRTSRLPYKRLNGVVARSVIRGLFAQSMAKRPRSLLYTGAVTVEWQAVIYKDKRGWTPRYKASQRSISVVYNDRCDWHPATLTAGQFTGQHIPRSSWDLTKKPGISFSIDRWRQCQFQA